VLDDRDRIAMALHDTVIQRLFASGLALRARRARSIRGHGGTGEPGDRRSRYHDHRDPFGIFALGDLSLGGLRNSVLALTVELTPTLGARPNVTISGPVDSAVPQHIADHVLAVIRESLTNASKHAQANSYAVVLRVGNDVHSR